MSGIIQCQETMGEFTRVRSLFHKRILIMDCPIRRFVHETASPIYHICIHCFFLRVKPLVVVWNTLWMINFPCLIPDFKAYDKFPCMLKSVSRTSNLKNVLQILTSVFSLLEIPIPSHYLPLIPSHCHRFLYPFPSLSYLPYLPICCSNWPSICI